MADGSLGVAAAANYLIHAACDSFAKVRSKKLCIANCKAGVTIT